MNVLIPYCLTLLLLVFLSESSAQTFQVVYSESAGSRPKAGLIQGSDGNFYGTTQLGGILDQGTVFKMTPTGTATILHSFNGENGSKPVTGLVAGNNGVYYGSTQAGGAGNQGTIFKITASGTHTVLHSFVDWTGGREPSGLVWGDDGMLYGTTCYGGAHNMGSVFKITTGGQHTVLHSFDGTSGSTPRAGLVKGRDGAFYGSTQGDYGNGTLFKITPAGAHTVLHEFVSASQGRYPAAELVQGADDAFYGTTNQGGNANAGTVFRITPEGEHIILHHFQVTDGQYPRSTLVPGSDGAFYGITTGGGVNSLGTIFRITSAGTHQLLHSFANPQGGAPYGNLWQESDGVFYGTTAAAGAAGHGTFFRFTVSGGCEVLHAFNHVNGGRSPRADLVQGLDGAFYGTAYEGGTDNHGTIYKVTSNGSHTLLHAFNGPDGSKPHAALAPTLSGNFYGTTYVGGSNNLGSVYEITPEGSHRVLHHFNGSNGSYPLSSLVPNSIPGTYGATSGGGLSLGTLYRIYPDGRHEILHSFTHGQGSYPMSPLVLSNGSWYGTTLSGGAHGGGTVFKFFGGLLSVLHSFHQESGQAPSSGLAVDEDGNLYGTTSRGGTHNLGTVYKLRPDGQHTVLHSFSGADGKLPQSGLIRRSDGRFFGTTVEGGEWDLGTIYQVTPGGEHRVLHSFDGSRGAFPRSTPILGSDGHLYGTADHMLVWRLHFGSPEFILTGNDQIIKNQSSNTQAANLTDFGTVNLAAGPVIHTFTITSNRLALLRLTGSQLVRVTGVGTQDFQVVEQPSPIVSEGVPTTFRIAFTPTVEGQRSTLIEIRNDAPGNQIFTFSIRGQGVGKLDTKNPTLQITSPAGKTVSTRLPLVISGIAKDNYAVAGVEMTLNNGAPFTPVLGEVSNASQVPFTAELLPAPGENTLSVTAHDPSGNQTTITHTFVFEERHLLTLTRDVAPSIAGQPDQAGVLFLKSTPAKSATPARDGNPQTSEVLPGSVLSVTALGKVGHLFSHWIGLPNDAEIQGNTAIFRMPAQDLAIIAVFTENSLLQAPWATTGSGTPVQGLFRPEGAMPSGMKKVGFINLVLLPNRGSLSGRVWHNGQVIPFSGVVHGNGSVWFKSGKTLASALEFAEQSLTLTWDETGLSTMVTHADETHSTGLARPPLYSRASPLRAELLAENGRTGYYTLTFPPVDQSPARAPSEYPQGNGHAGLSLTRHGKVNLAGMLSDGTKVTTATYLTAGDSAAIFVPMTTPGHRKKTAGLIGTLTFDETMTDSDVSSTDLQWFRPVALTSSTWVQPYRAGWPDGIRLGMVGSLYAPGKSAQTSLSLGGTGEDGNAALFFTDGKLPQDAILRFDLSSNKVLKIDPADRSWSMSLIPAKGLFRGTFTPGVTAAGRKPLVFTGMILQKGAKACGHGFFLSNVTGDTEPTSGGVELRAPDQE